MSRTPEVKVKEAIKAWLKARNVYYIMPIGGQFSTVGVPDFVCCINGRFLAIEAKAPGKRSTTTPMQKRQLALIEEAHGTALVVDDVAQLDEWEAQA